MFKCVAIFVDPCDRSRVACVCRTYLIRDIVEEMQLNGVAPDAQFLMSAIKCASIIFSACECVEYIWPCVIYLNMPHLLVIPESSQESRLSCEQAGDCLVGFLLHLLTCSSDYLLAHRYSLQSTRVGDCFYYFEEMRRRGMQPSDRLKGSLMSVLARNGDLEAAMAVSNSSHDPESNP